MWRNRCMGGIGWRSLGLIAAWSTGWLAQPASLVRPAWAADTVVAAGPKTPEEERLSFRLPPGFEAQLVASEPDIHKPINFAFDDRGRIWVTDTIEYPFPAPDNTPTRDTLKILDDLDEHGHARRITTFAENLNIPIGVLPLGDHAALAYSIPNIWRLTDTTGTGHADRREMFMGSIGHDDTHGMTGSFTEGYDGWIYAVHGFRNTSTIRASDGSQITLNSGNTYRFRRDGSHVEQFTHGQVNPFGLCVDPEGNLFSSDCETMPITLLIRESYHPSFGKPDDGLGFTPEVCDHMYGSTAIAGLCDYVADQFPPAFRGRMFVGNVVTNRINAARVVPRGSGFHADDVPDFLTTDDGWFRPVNIKLGPDGAVYVSDFYNRIIGHYEVDLHHPGRDKQRGRLWRIVYRGTADPAAAAAPPPPGKFDLTRQSPAELVDDLSSANLTIRMLATNRLADVIGAAAVAPLKAAMARHDAPPEQRAHGLWVLYRLGALDPAMLASAAADPSVLVREHAMRIVAEIGNWAHDERVLALAGLNDADPRVRRPAIEALGRHPAFDNLRPLLDLREHAGIDPFLLYTARIALRDQMLDPAVGRRLAEAGWNDADDRALADAAAGAQSPDAAAFLLRHVQRANTDDRDTLMRYLRLIAREVPAAQVDDLARFVRAKFADDLDGQLALFTSMQAGLAERGAATGEAVRTWGGELAGRLLADAARDDAAWTYRPIDGAASDAPNPWAVQMRVSADGNAGAPFLSSNVRGETLTGIARSTAFAVPHRLSFFLAGHNGPPPGQWAIKNVVRLRDAQTNEVLIEAQPPRNDVAQRVSWDLDALAGRKAYIEAVDGDNGTAYAWLAFGRFDPPVVRIPADGPQLQGALRVVETLHLSSLAGDAERILRSAGAEPESRAAAARALGALGPSGGQIDALAAVVRDGAAPEPVREAAADALVVAEAPAARAALVDAMRAAPGRTQLMLAKALAGTPAGGAALLEAVGQGKASARLLQDANVVERLHVSQPAAGLDERLKQLTRGLPAADAAVQRLIDERAAAYNAAAAVASPQRGRAVFQKNCMVCHMIGVQGAHVGPQLDGIGARGVARLCEDILDPSRNVDAAFRYSTFVLDDGTVIAGIVRREEGQTLTVADSTGKEIAIAKATIRRRVESNLSLMPSNFGEIIPPNDFNDLLSYLLSTRQP